LWILNMRRKWRSRPGTGTKAKFVNLETCREWRSGLRTGTKAKFVDLENAS
ncbi:9385_t:CDS:2, partial [Ambispora leptoticha]